MHRVKSLYGALVQRFYRVYGSKVSIRCVWCKVFIECMGIKCPLGAKCFIGCKGCMGV